MPVISTENRLRVLLVEDHRTVQEAIPKIVTAEHDNIDVVDRGDEVVATAERLMPGRAVTDLIPTVHAADAVTRVRHRRHA